MTVSLIKTPAAPVSTLRDWFLDNVGGATSINLPSGLDDLVWDYAFEAFEEAVSYTIGIDADRECDNLQESMSGSSDFIYTRQAREHYFEIVDGGYGDVAPYELNHRDYEDLDGYFCDFVAVECSQQATALLRKAIELWEELTFVERDEVHPHDCKWRTYAATIMGAFCGVCDVISEERWEAEQPEEMQHLFK